MNKICIFLTFSKEIDNFSNILKLLDKKKLIICLSDYDKTENEILTKFCKHNSLGFINFTEVIKKKIKFKILITQNFDLRASGNFSLRHFIKFVIKKILFKKKNYPRPTVKLNFKIISNKVYKFPKGLDASNFVSKKKSYKSFDKIFCHSSYDKNKLKVSGFKNTYIIGFPRYNIKDLNEKNFLIDEFNIQSNDKILFWLPSRLDKAQKKDANVYLWAEKLSTIAREFKFICRPHPDLISNDLIKMLRKKNFLVDTNINRRLFHIYKRSDYIFCDYGETIFSSLFFNKKLVLLNYDLNTDNRFLNKKFLDISAREYCPNFNVNENNVNDKIKKLISNNMEWKYLLTKRKSFLKKIFPEKDQNYYNNLFIDLIRKEINNGT